MHGLAVLLVVASGLYFWGSNVADEDLWNHLNWGAAILDGRTLPRVDRWSYTAAGMPFFDHEWLSDVVFTALFRTAGTAALVVVKLAIGLATVLALLDAVRTRARASGLRHGVHPATVAACLIPVLAATAAGASFRPQLFTMGLLALELALLERADRRLAGSRAGGARAVGAELVAVPLLVVAWANLHGGFLVGVALCGVFTAVVGTRLVVARRPPPWRDLALLGLAGLATAAAPLANPYGIALYAYLLETIGMHGRITEWMPVGVLSLDHARFKVVVVATAAAALPVWWARRRRKAALLDWRLLFAGAAAAYGFRHQRHTVLFAIAAAPLLAVSLEHVRLWALGRRPALRPRRRVVAAIGAGAVAIAGVQLAQVADTFVRDGLTIRYPRAEFPVDAVAFLRARGLGGNMAVQFEWGGYTLYHLGDAARVFIDGRFEATYPPGVIDDYFAFFEGAPGWERVLDAYPTEVVMVERTAPVEPLLAVRPDLVRAYADATAVVYLRRAQAAAAGIAAPAPPADVGGGDLRDLVFP